MSKQRIHQFVQSLRNWRKGIDRAAPKTPRAAGSASTAGDFQQSSPSARPAASNPQTLSKLGRLELIASAVVDGFLSGKHRSTHKGGCTDFAEFRPYAHGDDLRQLDWRHYARSDRYYVKQYDDETNLQALLIVDASGSMRFGMSTVSKWRYAQMACASLGQLLLRQRDSVGLAIVANQRVDFLRPQPRPNHMARLFDLLTKTEPQGESSLSDAAASLASRLKRRGMVIVFSDCFGDVAALGRALAQYRRHGHDVVVFQTLAPEELTFPFRRDAIFEDLEAGRRMQVNPNALRRAYLHEFQAFMDQLRRTMTDIGVDLMTASTGDDLGDVLSHHLRRRAAQKKFQGSAART